VPPTLDVYVWVEPGRRVEALKQFLDRYVDVDRPGDGRFDAFLRAYVTLTATTGDSQALTELRRDDAAGDEFSLYVKARNHYQANITITREGAVVLGLSLDDPYNSRRTLWRARFLLRRLCRQFSAPAGLAGVELPPPQSRPEWDNAVLVQLRSGSPTP
jgi:hypothetical protein